MSFFKDLTQSVEVTSIGSSVTEDAASEAEILLKTIEKTIERFDVSLNLRPCKKARHHY